MNPREIVEDLNRIILLIASTNPKNLDISEADELSYLIEQYFEISPDADAYLESMAEECEKIISDDDDSTAKEDLHLLCKEYLEQYSMQ